MTNSPRTASQASSPRTNRRRAIDRLVPITLLSLLVAGAVLYVVSRSVGEVDYNHDVAWILHCAERLLAGQRLYVDVTDNNPPLIFWLTAAIVSIGRSCHLPALVAYNATILLLVIASATAAARVARWSSSTASGPFGGALVGLLITILIFLPGYDYGQREHLAVVLLLPHVFVVGALLGGDRTPPTHWQIAAAVFAAPGLLIKPFFLLTWLLLELVLMLRARTTRICLRWANLVIVSLSSSYALAALLVHPEYIDVIRATTRIYGAYETAFPLLNGHTALLAISGLASWALPRCGFGRASARVLALSAAVFALFVVVQLKGFSYHWVPVSMLALSSIGVAALSRAVDATSRLGQSWLPIALPLALLVIQAGDCSQNDRRSPTHGSNPRRRALHRIPAKPYERGPVGALPLIICRPRFPSSSHGGCGLVIAP
jgi:hypothetical protein